MVGLFKICIFLIALFIISIIIIPIIIVYIRFKMSKYKIISGNNFFKTVFDKGTYGEYLTFKQLKELNGNNKILTNIYLPKKDGTTTEIDLLMISQTGIYVFESKNYSGWIFGNEKNKYWTQTFATKQKFKFFNPIWQNKGHISALQNVLYTEDNDIFKSYIVFSCRCSFRKINVISPNVKVLKRNILKNIIKIDIGKSNNILTIDDVDKLYLKLQKYTRVDKAVKNAHIESIKAKRV